MTAALTEPFAVSGCRIYQTPIDGDLIARAERAVDELLSRAKEQGRVLEAFARFPKPHLLLDPLEELAHVPVVDAAVQEVLGPRYGLWSSSIFLSEPGTGTGFSWHQDALHYDIANWAAGTVRVWIAMTDSTLENGTMWYAPGTHDTEFRRHVRDPATDELAVDPEDVPEHRVPVVLQRGQFSLHDLRLLHCSGRNSSSGRRLNVALDFVAPECAPGPGCQGVRGLTDGFTDRPWQAEARGSTLPSDQRHAQFVKASGRRIKSMMQMAGPPANGAN